MNPNPLPASVDEIPSVKNRIDAILDLSILWSILSIAAFRASNVMVALLG